MAEDTWRSYSAFWSDNSFSSWASDHPCFGRGYAGTDYSCLEPESLYPQCFWDDLESLIQLMTVARDWNDDPAQALCLEYQIWVQTREQELFTCHRNIAPVATTTDGSRIGISTCKIGSHVTLGSLWDVIDGGERTAIRIHLQ